MRLSDEGRIVIFDGSGAAVTVIRLEIPCVWWGCSKGICMLRLCPLPWAKAAIMLPASFSTWNFVSSILMVHVQ